MPAAGTEKWAMAMKGSDRPFACRTDQSLLTAMIEAGRTGIKVGCRNGGCGVCRVKVTEGDFVSQKMTRTRISEADEANGIVLACRIFPQSDILLEPMPLTIGRAAE